MLNQGCAARKFTKAEAPCLKGEIVIPLFRWHLVIGWLAQPPAAKEQK